LELQVQCHWKHMLQILRRQYSDAPGSILCK
jgi:hypothetical protein